MVFVATSTGCNFERQASVKLANKGVQSLNNGEFEVALGYLKKALAKDPTNTTAANLMGQIYFHDLRNHGEAKKAFQVALEGNKEHLDTLYRMGWLHFEIDKTAEARFYLTSCTDLEPEHGNCHYFLGKLFDAAGKIKEAEQSFRKAITLEPKEARAFNDLADIYLRVEAVEEAIQVLEESIRLNPYDAVSREKLGTLLLKRGEPARAAQMFLDAAQLSPQQHELLFAVGAAYVQSEERDAASHYLSRYLAKPSDGRKVERPNESLARVMLENLRRGPRLMAPVSAEEND